MLGNNNLRIILGSKSNIFKNIKARQKIRYSYKKSVYTKSLSKSFVCFLLKKNIVYVGRQEKELLFHSAYYLVENRMVIR